MEVFDTLKQISLTSRPMYSFWEHKAFMILVLEVERKTRKAPPENVTEGSCLL